MAGRLATSRHDLPDERKIKRMVEVASENSEEIIRSLNPAELMPILIERGVLCSEERELIIGLTCKDEQRQQLFKCFRRSPDSFIQCLESENTHCGHKYIAALVREEIVSTYLPLQMQKSMMYKDRMLHRREELISDIDMTYLGRVMYEQKLLTLSELEEIQRLETHTQKSTHFFNDILFSKGPLAFLRFVECLKNEHEVPRHVELFESIVGYKPQKAKKRSLDESSDSESDHDPTILRSVCEHRAKKRAVVECSLKWPLTGADYDDIMKALLGYHHSGQWDALQKQVDTQVKSSSTDPQLKAVALLEVARSYIFQKRWKCVDHFTQLARLHIDSVKEAEVNSAYLLCRMELIVSLKYIFLGDFQKAKDHLDQARVALFNRDINMPHSEYAAWLSYCSGCIRLEELCECNKNEEVASVVNDFKRVVEYMQGSDRCYDPIKHHANLRLAQLYLNCSHFTVGAASSSESIEKAQLLVDAVDEYSLPLRSQAIYHTVCSDLFRNTNNRESAEMHAKRALDISSDVGFMTEKDTAERRLKALGYQC